MKQSYEVIKVIDSHTGGEPTRIIIDGGPDLGDGPFSERISRFGSEFDHIRSAVVNEPRGSDVIVGGFVQKPTDPNCTTGIMFFNNRGTIGMCGHGTIGLIRTMQYLGKLSAGEHFVETPVGVVKATLHDNNEVSVQNVESYLYRNDVCVDVPGYGEVVGDIAWGGNWFFLVKETKENLVVANVDRLLEVTRLIQQTLKDQEIFGEDGLFVDHIELFAPSESADSKNFVLCPGGEYDRSPCGTGTSAKLACLAENGLLEPGQVWKQESIIGSIFEATYQPADRGIIPTIRGSAYICGESTLLLDPQDPFCMGIPK